MKINPTDFKMLRDFVNEKTGIFIRDDKAYFLENRLEVRLRESGCDSAQDYFRMLKYDNNGEEFDSFIELLTTNETYFFRTSSS